MIVTISQITEKMSSHPLYQHINDMNLLQRAVILSMTNHAPHEIHRCLMNDLIKQGWSLDNGPHFLLTPFQETNSLDEYKDFIKTVYEFCQSFDGVITKTPFFVQNDSVVQKDLLTDTICNEITVSGENTEYLKQTIQMLLNAAIYGEEK